MPPITSMSVLNPLTSIFVKVLINKITSHELFSQIDWSKPGVDLRWHMRTNDVNPNRKIDIWRIMCEKHLPSAWDDWRQNQVIFNTLRWLHNDRDGVSNRQPHNCFLNRLFRHRSKKTPKLRVTGLCGGNSPEAGEFPAQMASNARWRHHDVVVLYDVSYLYCSMSLAAVLRCK